MSDDWRDHLRPWLPESALACADPARSSMSGGGSPYGLSRMSAAKTCPQLFAYRYTGTKSDPHRYYLPPEMEPEPRFFGSLAHILMGYWEVSKMARALQPPWFSEMDSDARVRAVAGTRLDLLDEAYAMFSEYVRWWSNDRYITLGAEVGLEATVGMFYPQAPFEHHGLKVTIQLDRLAVDPDKKAVDIVDYKFISRDMGLLPNWSSHVSSDYAFQASAYLVIARAAGLPVRGFRIRRVKRSGAFDSNDNFVLISPENYAQVPRTLYEYALRAHRLEQSLASGVEPWLDFGACVGKYGKCDYHRVCHAPHTERLVQLARYTKKRNAA